MDLPKCKICGEKHRLGSCPQNSIGSATPKGGRPNLDRTTESGESVKASGRSESLHSPNAGPASKRGRIADNGPIAGSSEIRDSVAAGETAPKFDRADYHRNYMRDYMRERRRRQKEAKG